jgi:hypothetical protein
MLLHCKLCEGHCVPASCATQNTLLLAQPCLLLVQTSKAAHAALPQEGNVHTMPQLLATLNLSQQPMLTRLILLGVLHTA